MARFLLLIVTFFVFNNSSIHAQALPACPACSPFDVIYTPMGAMTRAEAEAFMQRRATLIAKQNERINRGVQTRVDATVAQFRQDITGNDAASAIRTRKWAADLTINLYAWGTMAAISKHVPKAKAIVKRLPGVPLRDAKFMLSQGLNSAGLIKGIAESNGDIKYTVTQYGGDTILNIIDASGKVGSKVLGRANAAVALGTLAIGSSAITAEAILDLSSNKGQTDQLQQAAARLVAQSPTVQLQLIQQTEDILRTQMAPTSPPLLTSGLGGILVEVSPVLSEDVTQIQMNALSQMRSLN